MQATTLKQTSLNSIRSLIDRDLEATDQFIVTQLNSDLPIIEQMIEYIITSGGKRIRPMVLLLAAKALNTNARLHIDLAAVIELIHTATLFHDDVVDGSTMRRGNKTANLIWGNQASVLVGDFLYSRAFQIVVELKSMEILDVFAKATHYIAEGEIMQLTNCNNPDTTEDFYKEIIDRKTAKLFEIAAQLGAMVTTQNPKEITAMRDFGQHFGLAYQMIDDALDYNQSLEETGKNVCQDIAEGKTTLPLIHAMKNSNGQDLELMRSAIKTGSSENIQAILSIIQKTNSIQYTIDIAKSHISKAKQALEILPYSPYRTALFDLCDFVLLRSY